MATAETTQIMKTVKVYHGRTETSVDKIATRAAGLVRMLNSCRDMRAVEVSAETAEEMGASIHQVAKAFSEFLELMTDELSGLMPMGDAKSWSVFDAIENELDDMGIPNGRQAEFSGASEFDEHRLSSSQLGVRVR